MVRRAASQHLGDFAIHLSQPEVRRVRVWRYLGAYPAVAVAFDHAVGVSVYVEALVCGWVGVWCVLGVCLASQILSDLLPAMVKLSSDDQDSVRLLSVETCIKLCSVVAQGVKTAQVMRVQRCAPLHATTLPGHWSCGRCACLFLSLFVFRTFHTC